MATISHTLDWISWGSLANCGNFLFLRKFAVMVEGIGLHARVRGRPGRARGPPLDAGVFDLPLIYQAS